MVNDRTIWCAWRKKNVCLTPEEWVRQHFLHRLVDDFGYPVNLIAVEVPLEIVSRKSLNRKSYRADAIVYTKSLQPLVLIEFKADTVPLTQKVLDQIVVYNRQLHVPYLVLHNGPQTIVARVTDNEITFLPDIPVYQDIVIPNE